MGESPIYPLPVATATVWQPSIVWGATSTSNGSALQWGSACAFDACAFRNIVWGDRCGGADCSGDTWTARDNSTVVWGTTNGDTVVWGTTNGDTVVWGTTNGDTVVWGTSDPEPVLWPPAGSGSGEPPASD
jgi:hypothetical protein